MAEETTAETTPTENDGISEDDLRSLIGEVLDEKLSTLSEGIGGLADSILEKLKGEPTPTSAAGEENLLEKIGGMIDEKLKGLSSGGTGNGNETKTERVPKLRVF